MARQGQQPTFAPSAMLHQSRHRPRRDKIRAGEKPKPGNEGTMTEDLENANIQESIRQCREMQRRRMTYATT